ncbi:hypothetical protein HQ544_00335 [Candidatus Falkowbacteria bacterium]|nr:hypothetical protein [Candidatus Falkowbacteria bacterium]
MQSEEREDGSKWIICQIPECKEPDEIQVRESREQWPKSRVGQGSEPVPTAF